IGVFVLILFMLIVLIGKSKGVKSIIALLYTLFLIVYLLLPAVFSGYSPVIMTIFTVILSTVVTLLLLNGQSQKTYSAIYSTITGVIISGVFFYLMSLILHLDGFSSQEAESLVLINQATGLQMKDVLFAGILISSLGAIMDVAMSIVSSLYEIHHHKPDLMMKELYHSGIEIGKDMIGTMSNTLILAFTGSAFISLLVLFSFQVDIKQLFNSNYIMIEFAQGISGTLGIILTVPISSLMSAYFLKKNDEDYCD
ncbi:MAG: YibE/F family protein, partial [Faecalibacillus sp.]